MNKIVITGQQIGLLGGPLYTTYKVLGAVRYAREIDGDALYWLETNDADFNEINHIKYLDSRGELQTLIWDIDSGGCSCGLVEVDDLLVAILKTFFSTLRQTEFTPALRNMALRCYKPGRTMAEASSLLAHALFDRFDIRIFTPAEKEFRDFTRQILLKEADRTPDGEQVNLFCMVGKRRQALFKKDGQFLLRDGTLVDLSRYELVPNVKTRNVCQDAYFKSHTYVAGPGEMKYIAELDPLYQFHGVKKAAVKPRMSVILIEPRVARLLEKTAVSLQEVLMLDKVDLIKKGLKERSGFDYKELRLQADAATAAYLEKLAGLKLDTRDIRKLLGKEVKKICGKRRSGEKERHQNLLETLEFLSDNLKPFGKEQERVFNIFYYMNLYGGIRFINWIYEKYDPGIDTLEIKYD